MPVLRYGQIAKSLQSLSVSRIVKMTRGGGFMYNRVVRDRLRKGNGVLGNMVPCSLSRVGGFYIFSNCLSIPLLHCVPLFLLSGRSFSMHVFPFLSLPWLVLLGCFGLFDLFTFALRFGHALFVPSPRFGQACLLFSV